MRLKVVAIALAAVLATTQVTGCSSTGSGGSGRDSWIDPEIVIAATAILVILAAGFVAASQNDE
jgi:hypothetical protein